MNKIKTNSSTNLFLVVTIILVAIILVNPPHDPDMWWHLRSGQVMWENKTILTQDTFSYTRDGYPWVNVFWLADLFLYEIYSLGGFSLLTFAVTIIGIFVLLPVFLNQKANILIKSSILILSALCLSPQWAPRPQIFSFLLLVNLNSWLEKRKTSTNPPFFLLPLLFILWANLHGGFIWGFLLLVASIVGLALEFLFSAKKDDAQKHYLISLTLWTMVSLFTVLLNPNGIGVWKLPFYTVDVSIAIIQEWLSPDFHKLISHPFLWMIFLFIIALSQKDKRLPYDVLLKTLGFSYMAFVSQRNIPVATIIIAPELLKITENFEFTFLREIPSTRPNRVSKIINFTITSILLLIFIGRLTYESVYRPVSREYPEKAISWIKSNLPPGNIFNSYNYGGYILWSLPEYPVFIDGRADLYGDGIIEDWLEISSASENAGALLDQYNINLVLIEPDTPIIDYLIYANWEIPYRDENAVILVRP